MTTDHTKKRPTHTAYTITGPEGSRGRWREIGAAWATSDNRGFVVQLDCYPRDGRVVLREAERRPS